MATNEVSMARTGTRLAGWTLLEDRLAPAVTIRFDYTFDDPAKGGLGFFNDPARRAMLEKAGDDFESRISSTPTAIAPGGSNSWTATFFNPSNGAQATVPNLSVATGEMVVFVGAMAMGSNEAGLGGTGGFQATGNSQFITNLRTRGQSGFATWGGSLSLDTTVDWYTGSSTIVPEGMFDLYTVVTHELGHVFGFGTSAQFNQLFNGPFFVGAKTVEANGGNPVALSGDLAHWAQGTTSNGVPASMQPMLVNGIRYGFSQLDYASLADIGWQITSGPVQPPRAGSTTVVTTSPVSPTAFTTYTLSAQVSRTGQGIPTGSVTFRVGGLTVGTTSVDANGKATITTQGMGAGSYTVTASYLGDTATQPSVGNGTVVIAPAPTGTPPLAPDKITSLSGADGGYSQLFRFTTQGGLTIASPAFQPFGWQSSSVRSATGDFNGDGVPDTVYVTGVGGGSFIRAIDGRDASNMAPMIEAFESSFTGGLYVAAGDVDGDGQDDIVVSPDQGGGGRVTIYKIVNGALQQFANFFGIDDPDFRGGARVAVGDVNGDGQDDVIVGAGFGGGPRVAIFDGQSVSKNGDNPSRLVSDFFAFGGADIKNLRNGIFISAGDINGDGKADLVFGGGPGGGPRVTVVSGLSILQNPEFTIQTPISNFFAFDSEDRGGVRPQVKDVDGDGKKDLVVGSGEGNKARVRIYRGSNLVTPILDVEVFNGANLSNGVYVG
jgi:hypothetical protein